MSAPERKGTARCRPWWTPRCGWAFGGRCCSWGQSAQSPCRAHRPACLAARSSESRVRIVDGVLGRIEMVHRGGMHEKIHQRHPSAEQRSHTGQTNKRVKDKYFSQTLCPLLRSRQLKEPYKLNDQSIDQSKDKMKGFFCRFLYRRLTLNGALIPLGKMTLSMTVSSRLDLRLPSPWLDPE